MRSVIRPVASLQELAQTFDLIGPQPPQRLSHHPGASPTLPADRSLMLVAQDPGRIVGGALAFRTDPASPACDVTVRPIALTLRHRRTGVGRRLVEQVEAAAIGLDAREVSLGVGDVARELSLRMSNAGRARLRKQLPVSSARQRRAEGWRCDLDDLRQRHERRLAALAP